MCVVMSSCNNMTKGTANARDIIVYAREQKGRGSLYFKVEFV